MRTSMLRLTTRGMCRSATNCESGTADRTWRVKELTACASRHDSVKAVPASQSHV
jgi:hypothetical protein